MGGYVEVDPAEYAAFAAEWVAAAGAALRPGGYLAVVTGGQQAARVQPPQGAKPERGRPAGSRDFLKLNEHNQIRSVASRPWTLHADFT